MHAKTKGLIEAAYKILDASEFPMTIRQLHYRLVSLQITPNTQADYKRLIEAMVTARKTGMIPWESIEDRTRRPRRVPQWDDRADFLASVIPQYRRDVWQDQPREIEVWLEKDALSGIFEAELAPFGVTLCVNRGYNSWSAAHEATEARLYDDSLILYFGDFDPSGEDMVRFLGEQLGHFQVRPEIRKVAILREDIEAYGLPADFTKAGDSRSAAFVAKNGNQCVELDALPLNVLRQRIVDSVEEAMDLDALDETRRQQAEDMVYLRSLLPKDGDQ